jgi:hypothetical protein
MQVEISEELSQRYDQIAEKLNVSRAKNGQEPITGSIVMRVVLAQFAGLPRDSKLGIDELEAIANFRVTPPHGG